MKRICLLQRDEFGFSSDLETLTPRKLPQDELQTFPGFMDYDVKQLLKRTNDDDRRLAWIDDRPGSYTVRRIYACPVCGGPLKPYGVAMERKHGRRFTCGWVEHWAARGLSPDEAHGYNRVWSEDDLTPKAVAGVVSADELPF